MANIVKISTPDGGIPSVPNPIEGTHYTVIDGSPSDGDLIRISAGQSVAFQRYAAPVAPTPSPKILSKTAFQDYAVSQLGSGLTGMGRFTAVMDATRDSASGAVRFAFARYEAADKFEKDNTATLTAVMAADSTTGHLTESERTAILDNWPTT